MCEHTPTGATAYVLLIASRQSYASPSCLPQHLDYKFWILLTIIVGLTWAEFAEQLHEYARTGGKSYGKSRLRQSYIWSHNL